MHKLHLFLPKKPVNGILFLKWGLPTIHFLYSTRTSKEKHRYKKPLASTMVWLLYFGENHAALR